jgi:hypothetical protein
MFFESYLKTTTSLSHICLTAIITVSQVNTAVVKFMAVINQFGGNEILSNTFTHFYTFLLYF